MGIMKERDGEWSSTGIGILVVGGIFALVFGLIIIFGSWFIVSPGERAIKITLGKADSNFVSDGFHTKMPLLTSVEKTIIRQQTREMVAEVYSSDLQQMKVTLKVLYRIPESQVVSLYRDYHGEPFDSLIGPRIQESIKEVSATMSAEGVVKNRELIKQKTLEIARKKIGDLLRTEDIVIENIDLSKELEKAIEEKMVQSQHAEKAKFAQVQAKTDADTAVITAQGTAEAIRIMGNAIANNPKVVELKIVEKWNGVSPTTVVTSGGGANVILPLK
jgi:prohibitin 2